MKFESKFGVGEIVMTHMHERENRYYRDMIIKVIAVTFGNESDGKPVYLCRVARTGLQVYYAESELIGDPEFCQTTGKYPDEKE